MTTNRPSERPPFRVTPIVLHVLLTMADGETHGYRIMKEVAERTHGRLKIGPGSLYFTLDRLLSADLIEEAEPQPKPEADDSRRKYYQLTAHGRDVLREEVRSLADLVDFARGKQLLADPEPV